MVRLVSLQTSQSPQMFKFVWTVDELLTDSTVDSGTIDFCDYQLKILLEEKSCYERQSLYYTNDIDITLSKINSPKCLSKSSILKIQTFIVDENKQARFRQDADFDVSKETKIQAWSLKLNYSNLDDIKSTMMKNGAITIILNCTLHEGPIQTRKEEKAAQATVNADLEASAESLAVDFRHLLDDGTYSDISFKCGDRTTPAHRSILSARSKVLAAMLRSDMAENRSSVIEISDMSPTIFDQFVQFIYSAKLSDLTLDTAPDLYAAGDKYDIDSLKGQCSAFMKKHIADENACSILALADAHSDGDLKETAISYIMEKELMRKDDIWLKFCKDHPALANEVLNRAYKLLRAFKEPK